MLTTVPPHGRLMTCCILSQSMTVWHHCSLWWCRHGVKGSLCNSLRACSPLPVVLPLTGWLFEGITVRRISAIMLSSQSGAAIRIDFAYTSLATYSGQKSSIGAEAKVLKLLHLLSLSQKSCRPLIYYSDTKIINQLSNIISVQAHQKECEFAL